MKKLKDTSLWLRLLIPFSIILLGVIIHALLVRNFSGALSQYDQRINLAEANKLRAQQTARQAQLILAGERDQRENLENTLIEFDQTLNVLKLGGIAPHSRFDLSPVDTDFHRHFHLLEDLWIDYKKNAQPLLTDSLYLTTTAERVISVDTLGNEITERYTIKNRNPRMDSAAFYMNKHVDDLTASCHQLITVFEAQKEEARKSNQWANLIIVFVDLIVLILGIIFIKRLLIHPLRHTSQIINSIAKGNLANSLESKNDNEVGQIMKSLNNLQQKLKDKLTFIQEVTKGNYEASYEIEDEEDVMGKSLLDMRENFQKAALEEAKRKEEDKKQNWTTQTLAQLGDILRRDNDNLETLGYNIVSFLVDVLGANQGGIFVINDEDEKDKHIELVSSVAYNKRKFLKKRIEFGEGVVGRCVLEKKTIFMTNVPETYVNITSGLGEEAPRNLADIPLMFNEQIFGVLEIAAFNQLEPHQVAMLEKAAESIASTISTVKINVTTALLLRESQEQAEKRSQQEEEMRQNLEELNAAQEEARRQEERLISFTDSVNHTLIRAEYETDGTLIYANTKFLEKLGYHYNQEVEGRHISMFIDEKDREWFDKMWDPLSKGGRHYEGNMKHRTKMNTDLWMMATYTAVRRQDRSVEKILFLAIDTTDQKEESLDHKGQIDALENSSVKAEFSPQGRLIKTNQLFLEALDYKAIELENKTIFDLIAKEEVANFKVAWDNTINGIPYKGEVNIPDQDKQAHWFHATFTAVNDMYGEVNKVIFIGNDITEQKKAELLAQQQQEELNKRMKELTAMQDEMAKKQEDLQKAKEKLESNEVILKKALEEAKAKEYQLQEQSNRLVSSEEELRQNLEELQTTQEEMARKQKEIVAAKEKLESNEQILKKSYTKAKEREKEIEEKNAELTAAEEELRQNLEELQATQEEMSRKQKELEVNNQKLATNEKIMKKTMEKMRKTQMEAKQKADELQAQEEEMKKKNEELMEAKKKLTANEQILKKALEKSKKREKEIDEKNAALVAAEEELRQNLEELQATQEELERVKNVEQERAQKQIAARTQMMTKKLEEFKKLEASLREEIKRKDEEIARLKK